MFVTRPRAEISCRVRGKQCVRRSCCPLGARSRCRTARLGAARERRHDCPGNCRARGRQQVSPALIFLAGIVRSVHVRDAKWPVATNLNDCRHFGERIMVGIRREFDEPARTKLTGPLLVQLVAGPEMKFTRDNRYTFSMRMFVGWNLVSRRHF